MSDSPAALGRTLLLVVLFAPLVAALACAITRGMVRRVAAGFALYHVVATAALIALTLGAFTLRGEMVGRSQPPMRFAPLAVPGDTSTDPNLDNSETSWTLLTLGPTPGPGMPPPAIQFYIGLDGFNLWLVALASVMTLVAVLASWNLATERRAGFLAWVFVLQFAVTGAFLSFDLILFYVFFELTLVPTFFLIGRYGVGGGRREAARTFVLYTLFGSLLTLAGAVGIVVTNPTPVSPHTTEPNPMYRVVPDRQGQPIRPIAGPVTFNIPRLMSNVRTWSGLASFEVDWAARLALPANEAATVAARAAAATPTDRGLAETAARARVEADRLAAAQDAAVRKQNRRMTGQFWLFLLLVAGFAIKTPLVPFHSWLPAAYAEAPIGATLLFSAILAKLGTYGLLRLVLPLCPDASVAYGLPVFGTLGAVGIVYAGLCAYAQRDLKLLAAYSSVSHLGFLVVGLFTLTPEGLSGAALHMVNHGLTAGGLFAVLAVLYDRYHTLDQHAYGGLAARLPGYAVLTMVICLAGIGLPGLNSFVSEMLLLSALFDPEVVRHGGFALAVAAAAGLFISAWYIITMLRRVLFGPLRLPSSAGDAPPPPLTRIEGFALGIPVVLCLILGLFPQPVLTTMRSEAELLSWHLRAARVNAEQPDLAAPAEAPRP